MGNSPDAATLVRMSKTRREDLLEENRRNRDEIRAEQERKDAKRDRVPGRVENSDNKSRLTAILAGLAAVLVVTTIVFGYLAFRGHDETLGPGSGIGEQALNDAKKYAVDIVTYSPGDYSQVDKRIREISTPDFAARTIDSAQTGRTGNDEAQATSTAKVVAAGLQSITDDQAVVLLALNQKVTSPQLPTAGAEGVDYPSRVLMTLKRSDDKWLVDDLDIVQ